MKKIILFVALAALAMTAATFTSCDKHTWKTVESITISPKPVTIAVGKTIQLEAIVEWSKEGDAYMGSAYGYVSSDETVATVKNGSYGYFAPDGTVTGVAVGTATITYQIDDKSDTCVVTVVAAEE